MKLKARVIEMWGKRRRITPRLVIKKIGDGKKLINIFPMNERPNRWIIQVDSTTDITSDDFYYNILEQIYELIEDQFGPSEVDGKKQWFPAAAIEDGIVWTEADYEREEVDGLLKGCIV